MILTHREKYISRVHREINARTEKQKRKHSYNELDSIKSIKIQKLSICKRNNTLLLI